jgi:hypothetical protein
MPYPRSSTHFHHDKKTCHSRRRSRRLPRCNRSRKHGLGRRNIRSSSWYLSPPTIPPPTSPHIRHFFFHERLTLDMRLPSSQTAAQQRSINLAVSSRGIAAIQAIDPVAASRFLDNVIPMRGRMIHDSSGNLDSQPYDRNGQVGRIYSQLIPSSSCSRPCAAFVPRPEFPCSLIVHQLH